MEQRKTASAKAGGPRGSVLGTAASTCSALDKARSTCKSETVARGSGLAATCGTFGKSARFSDKVRGPGQDSAKDKEYYARNRLWKGAEEEGRSTALGFGHRPHPGEQCGAGWHYKDVGPGSYEMCASVAKHRSPLDGADYCSLTMAKKLIPGGCIGAGTAQSPGPHARYQVSQDLVIKRPNYRLPTLGGHIHVESSKNKLKEIPQDNDDVGPGHYFQGHKSIAVRAQSQSVPNLHSSKGSKSSQQSICEDTADWSTGGTKQFVRGTFGLADRFPSTKKPITAEDGKLYYAHVKLWNQDDYLAGARSCSLGSGTKTDFTNPTRTHKNEVSPATYAVDEGHSATKATSPIDGFAQRSPSPVRAFGGNLHKPQTRKGPTSGGGSREDTGVSFAEGTLSPSAGAEPVLAASAEPAAVTA